MSQRLWDPYEQICVQARFAKHFVQIAGIAAHLPGKPRNRQVLPLQFRFNHISYVNFHLRSFQTKVIFCSKNHERLQGLQKGEKNSNAYFYSLIFEARKWYHKHTIGTTIAIQSSC